MLGVYRKGRKEKLRTFAVIEQRKSVEPDIRCRCLLSAIVGGMMTIAGIDAYVLLRVRYLRGSSRRWSAKVSCMHRIPSPYQQCADHRSIVRGQLVIAEGCFETCGSEVRDRLDMFAQPHVIVRLG